MAIFDSIQKPTLLLDEAAVRRNIHRMSERARAENVRFRPHFKTHQSAEIGSWFRAEGVTAITVSSLEMAEYFTAAGWNDLTVAFPANLREIDTINRLAGAVKLGLLVEMPETVQFLDSHLTSPVDAWIKVDSGAGRTGLRWDHPGEVCALARLVEGSSRLRFRGLLTHAGHTYPVSGAEKVSEVYLTSVERMNWVRQAVLETGFSRCEVSTGDTPGTTLSPTLGQVDEIRPGNFVLYDAHQLLRDVCRPADVAAVVACPVVACHAERSEVVIYGGAIHLSKDFVFDGEKNLYGLVGLPDGERWTDPIPGAYVRALSQEHGIVRLPADVLNQIHAGDLLCIFPAHSCLTVQVMRRYLSLDGHWISTLNQ